MLGIFYFVKVRIITYLQINKQWKNRFDVYGTATDASGLFAAGKGDTGEDCIL